MRGGLILGCWLVTSLTAGAAFASVFDELHGVRSLSMGGAHRGLGTTNDTLYLNPAGMALGRRYSVEMGYGYSPFDELTRLNASVVDSKSGPVAGSIAYTHDRGDADGVDAAVHRIYMGAAYPLSEAFALELQPRTSAANLVDNGDRRKLSLYTGDVGIITRLGQGVGVGLTAHNVVKTEMTRLTPLTFGAG